MIRHDVGLIQIPGSLLVQLHMLSSNMMNYEVRLIEVRTKEDISFNFKTKIFE